MPDLAMPIFNCEPVTSLVGNMLFPNDAGEAMSAAAWHLDGAVLNAPSDALRGIDESRLWAIRAAARNYSKDRAEAALYQGTQIGAAVSYLWQVPGASFEDACRAVIDISSIAHLPGARSTLYESKTGFARVLHFWGVLSNDHQNRWPRDFRLFTTQAHVLLRKMRLRNVAGQTFSSPKYVIQLSDFNFAVPGEIRIGKVLPQLLPQSKKRAGRPPRKAVQE
jgi:hypothetical protein